MLTVRTENGYVGRSDLGGELTDTQEANCAYTWDSLEQAKVVAARFGGEVVEDGVPVRDA